MSKKKDPNERFETVLKTADLTNLGKDYSEIILDSFIDDEKLFL